MHKLVLDHEVKIGISDLCSVHGITNPYIDKVLESLCPYLLIFSYTCSCSFFMNEVSDV